MKEILQKLSSYNIFNYLLPGIIFVVLLRFFTSYDLIIDEAILGAFLYYFIGMIISRIGSLIIEPLLKKMSIVKFADYHKFVKASGRDNKIELFSEVNNIYRTFISLFMLLLIVVIYEQFSQYFNLNATIKTILIIMSLIVLFICSYRKQTKYITKRIDAVDEE